MRILLIVIGLLVSFISKATTITATNVTYLEVLAAYNKTTNGDTLLIPAGIANWTNTLNVNKPITIQGQTVVSGVTSNMSVSRQTVITNGWLSGPGNLFIIGTTNGTVRITGISFLGGAGGAAGAPSWPYGGDIEVDSQCPLFRIDHNEFATRYNNAAVYVVAEYGVIDHNFDTNMVKTFTDLHHENSDRGDASWAAPLTLGSDHNIFIEDNKIICGASKVQAIVDSQGGARYVVRYNYQVNSHTTTHGTESGGWIRAPRSWEVYKNIIITTLNGQANAVFIRGGTGVQFSNTFIGPFGHGTRLINYRDCTGMFPNELKWHGADGTNAWDINETTDHTGNGLGGGTNGLWASGTHVGGNNSLTLVVSGTPWTVNQWAYYSIKNMDATNLNQSSIFANDANTATYMTVAPNLTFNTGDHYQIRKVLQSFDHVGSGQSDPVGSGANPIPGWRNQIIEPAYFWANTLNGSSADIYTESNIILGTDYFQNTVKPSYTPYVYPHPLVSGTAVTNATLFVTSVNPSSTVAITVTPLDNNGVSDGTTPFNRTYTTNVVVTNIAPSTANLNIFQKWTKDGVDLTTNLTATVTMESSHTLAAVYVGNGTPPITAFHASPTTGTKPLFVSFVDDTGNATSWRWVFGDGSSNTLQNLSHTYTANGTYTVSLTTANDTGTNTLTKVNYITVSNTPNRKGSISREKPLLDLP